MPNLRTHRAAVVPIELLENRRLLSVSTLDTIQQETVVIGTPHSTGVSFTATNGRYSGLRTGSAVGTLVFSGTGVPVTLHGHVYFPRDSVETVDSIVLTDAVPGRASLLEIGSPGTGLFNIGSIAGGNLNTILAPDVNLTGSMNLDSLNSIVIGGVTGAAITLGKVAGVKVNGVMTGSLTAGTIGSFSAFEMVKARITATAPFSASKLDIGSINGGAGIEQSEIISAGNIGSVRARFIENSIITAAANPPAAPAGQYPTALVPEFSSDFTAPAFIRSVTVIPGSSGGFFNNSVITAQTIGSVNLGQMGATASGLAAHTIGSVSLLAPVGSLNLTVMHLGYAQMRTSARLAATLAARGIADTVGALGADNILVLNLNLNVLR